MTMGAKIRFLRQLDKLAKQADRFGILLPNGGEVGSLLGSMASDLQTAWEIPDVCVQNNSENKGIIDLTPL